MEHKDFPEQEQPDLPPVPLEPEEVPKIQELLFDEELPVIQDLTFPEYAPGTFPPLETPSSILPQELPAEEPAPILTPSAQDEDLPPLEEGSGTPQDIPAEDPAPIPVPPVAEEPSPLPDPPAGEMPITFMDKIPDTDLDYPNWVDAVPARELLPDEQAMDSNGLLSHGEAPPDFDGSLLNDPDLLLPEEAVPVEEIPDQDYQASGQEFDDLLKAPAAPQPKAAPLPRQTSKGRPKRKKGEGLFGIPNILVTVVWLALIVMIGVTAGRMLWVCAADVLAFGREDKAVTITVYEADTMDQIIDKLYDGGLIRYKSLFKLYADISDAQEDIKPGIYDLNTRYDYHALVNFMSPRSSREVITLTIPEGYTCRQIFSLLEENRICTAVDAAAYAASGELDDYWFLEGVQRGTENSLEGYLFPDTYEFYKNSTPKEALSRMLNNFEVKFTEEMRGQLDTLNAKLTGDYTVREIVIVASLIEKESASPEESPSIAGVIYNRLFDWGDTPAYLNIDASIVYALDGKSALTREDLQMDHPYNTYTNVGLTPGPISNPGLASLKAALNPASHNYYYYVLNPSTGMHQFSTTYEEHTGYVNKFAEE